MKIINYIMVILFLTSVINAKPIWKQYREALMENNAIVEELLAIKCLDNNDCIALIPYFGYYARLYSSTDKGKTWLRFWDDFTGDYEDWREMAKGLAYTSKDKIFLTFYNSLMLKSSNRGKDWDTVRFQPSGVRLEYIYMPDTLNGFILNLEFIYLTNDGWNTYTTLNTKTITNFFPSNPLMYGSDTLVFFSSQNGVARYHNSFDQGKTWSTDTIPSQISIAGFSDRHLFSFNNGIMYLVGGCGNGVGDQSIDIICKLDSFSGKWREIYRQENEYKFGLQEIAFADSLNGVAVGQFGKVLRTTDGGNTWFQEYLTKSDGKIDDDPVLHVTYAGDTPLIGDFSGRIFRLEDDGTDAVVDNKANVIQVLYPNPATEYINLNPWIMSSLYNIEIYNSIGECVLKSEMTNSIDISDLSSGVYILKIGRKVYNFVKI